MTVNVNNIRNISASVYDTASSSISTGNDFAEIREAMETIPTTTGVRIGDLYIDCIKRKNDIRTYNVRSATGKIVSDLSLYEAAYALVRALNKNHSLGSAKIATIMKLEADYSKSLNDTLHFKHNLSSKTLSDIRRNILESLYDTAKHNAALAVHRIKELVI